MFSSHASPPSPLDDPQYLSSPVNILVASQSRVASSSSMQNHDLIDAYSTLCARLVPHIAFLEQSIPVLPALVPLSDHSTSIAACLHRDLLVAASILQSTPAISEPLLNLLHDRNERWAYGVANAVDLCHQALKLISVIFQLRALNSLFSPEMLQAIMIDVLHVGREVATRSSEKSQSLVVWIMRVQQLPVDVVVSQKAGLIKLFEDSLSKRHQSSQFAKIIVVDSLSAIIRLVKQYRHHFLDPVCHTLLPLILDCLVSPHEDLRDHASSVLASVSAIFSETETEAFKDARSFASAHSCSFLRSQVVESQSGGDTLHLPGILKLGFPASSLVPTSNRSSNNRFFRAMSTLASLIILCDYGIFSSKKVLYYLATSLGEAVTGRDGFLSRSRRVLQLQMGVWRCICWAYWGLLDSERHHKRMNFELGSPKDRLLSRFVPNMQDEISSGSIGISIVAALLGPSPSARSTRDGRKNTFTAAVRVIGVMVGHRREGVASEGRRLLFHCLSHLHSTSEMLSGDSSHWSRSRIIPGELFEEAQIVTNFSLKPVGLDIVRQFTEEEVASGWDSIVRLWETCILKAKTTPLSADAIAAWQTLLLAPTHLTQGKSHLTAEPTFTNKAVASLIRVLDEFVTDIKIECDVSLARLAIITQLWAVLKNVFSTHWLCLTAQSILIGIFTRNFDMEQASVREAWCRLCADLVEYGDLEIYTRDFEEEVEEELCLKYTMWSLAAENWCSRSNDSSALDDVVELLVLAFKSPSWSLSYCRDEYLDFLRRVTNTPSINPTELMEKLLQRFDDDPAPHDMLCSILNIYTNSVADRGMEFIPQRLLEAAGRAANHFYDCREDELAVCLQVVCSVRIMENALATPLLVRFLGLVDSWMEYLIRDPSRKFTDRDYNDVIIEFYTNSLLLLENIPAEKKELEEISAFIISIFDSTHIPISTSGSNAFSRYCRAKFGSEVGQSACPQKILNAWRAYAEATGDFIPTSPSIVDSAFDREVVWISSPSIRHAVIAHTGTPPRKELDHNDEFSSPLSPSHKRTSLMRRCSSSPRIYPQEHLHIAPKRDDQRNKTRKGD